MVVVVDAVASESRSIVAGWLLRKCSLLPQSATARWRRDSFTSRSGGRIFNTQTRAYSSYKLWVYWPTFVLG